MSNLIIMATAFCPAHITGFFKAELDKKDSKQLGSLGAGFSIQKGVKTTVTIRNKTKLYKRSQKLLISQTSLGISNGISGLTTSTHYGTRVEDEEICLNVPDVANILAIYESSNSESPILDKLVFSSQSISGAIVGEKIYGSLSEAVGQITDIQGTDVSFVYLNSNKFK